MEVRPIGATEEGTFRSHIITAEGQAHDAVFYSVIESEWPHVRARLREMLDCPYRGAGA